MSALTGKTYRLLSEAEREYVTRVGSTGPFWWGAAISTDQANYNGTIAYAGGVNGEWRKATVPVDSFSANPWGLYHVHGNVWEWTEDCWNEKNAGNPGTARQGRRETAVFASCAALPSTTRLTPFARPGAKGMLSAIAPIRSAFVSPGRCTPADVLRLFARL